MKLDAFKKIALKTIKDNHGLTRMEWFLACCSTSIQRNTLWHTFKFQVALQLILDGRIKADVDLFFHVSHNTQ